MSDEPIIILDLKIVEFNAMACNLRRKLIEQHALPDKPQILIGKTMAEEFGVHRGDVFSGMTVTINGD